jgi:predicted permease
MQAEVLHNVAAIPGVVAAGFASQLPLEVEYHNGNPVEVEGKTPADQVAPNRTTDRISPGLFAAQGTRLITGRDFTWDDVFQHRRVAIVSNDMARENWGTARNAIDQRIRMDRQGPWTVVVGVAENVSLDGVDRKSPPTVYFPARGRGMTLAVRSTRTGTDSFLREITAAIRSVNASLPLANVRTLEDLYRLSIARSTFTAVLLGMASAMALTLALIGVYGVVAFAVNQRRREVGIRVALGAHPEMIKSLFLRRGLMVAGLGCGLGTAGAAALSRWISSLLFGITPLDPITYTAAAGVVLAAAMAASYLPAYRAAATDPTETLRSD